MPVHTNSFLTPDLWKQFAVTPGDKLLTVGFFRLYPGKHQFQPMIREGTLAMVPDDKMPSTVCDFPTKVYLADVHVIPGNSGSPMFLGPRAFLGGMLTPPNGSAPFVLLGVVSGYLYEDSDLTLRTTTDYAAVLHANSGIAIVVPAEELYTLLASPELQQLRDRAVANFKAQTPSSGSNP
jgi:phage tail protein X